MDAERWRAVDEVFAACLELPFDRRLPFLDQRCSRDPELRAEVERLLVLDAEAESFLQAPEDPPGREAGTHSTARIGPYRLIRQIGAGGMGRVYLALRDEDFRKQVALKLIHAGLASREHLSRFNDERQALARLDHPFIARLHDGGSTPEGLPYLVMELVDGLRIDAYCDRHGLDVRQRLKLFRKVCEAVRYAHRNLLVHRDLKPANILVTAEGTPKLLDFGIAKLLGHGAATEDEPTRTGLRLMTPSYASPEQIRGDPITTASDVYSLGVLLYELLSGRSPYAPERGSAFELERAVCECDPELASQAAGRLRGREGRDLARRLRGDLDSIVARAMRKEPERRYASVEELERDVKRHLDDRPVHSRRGTWRYRTHRFLRRHRVSVALTALFLALIGVSFFVVIWQAGERARERDKARLVTDFVLELFETANPEGGLGQGTTARQLLDLGTKRLGRAAARDPDTQAALLDTIGTAYLYLGRAVSAEPLLGQALELRQTRYGAHHADSVSSLTNLAWAAYDQGGMERAEELARRAVELGRGLRGEEIAVLARALRILAMVTWSRGQLEEAESLLRESLELNRSVFGSSHRAVAEVGSDLAALLARSGRTEQAEPLVLDAMEIRRRELGEAHPETARSLRDLATLRFEQARFTEAEELYRQSLERHLDLFPIDHPLVSRLRARLARSLEATGHLEEAEVQFREAVAGFRRQPGGDHPELATALHNLGVLLGNRGDFEDAKATLEQSFAMRRRIFGDENLEVTKSRYSLAVLLQDQGDLDTAEALYLRAMEGAQALPPGHPARTYPAVGFARLILDRGRPKEAEERLRAALPLLEASHPPNHFRVVAAESVLGASLADQGRYLEAEPILHRSYRRLLAQRGERDPRTQRARRWLAELTGAVE